MKCQKCQTEHTTVFSFCNKCGSKMSVETANDYTISIKKTKIFFFTLLGYIGLLNVLKFESTYITSLICDCVFAFIVIIFFIYNYNEQVPLVINKIKNGKLLAMLCGSLMVFACLVSWFAGIINQNTFNGNNSTYYEHYASSPFPLPLCILSIAVFPAIFEEIAFRGILFNDLLKITSINATIIISAMLFTILHFSFISFLWIFPSGLLFGYLRSKYNSVLYGVIGHFTYNSSVVLIEYFWF